MDASASTTQPQGSAVVRVNEPVGSSWTLPDLRELWQHRDLVYFLARRDVAVRYKQAIIGVFWAILQPLLLAGAFSIFFGLLAKIDPPKGIPYPLFAVSGMVIWLFFANAVAEGSESTVKDSELISKVYFPRIAIPVASVAPGIIDFAFGFVVVLGITFAYGFVPQPAIVLIPLVAALTAATALGVVLWLSALNVRYRDVHLVIPFLILIGLFTTPIVYPFDLVPDNLQPLYALNPMVGILEVYRWMLLGTAWPGYIALFPVVISVILVVSGAAYFQRAERSFADVI